MFNDLLGENSLRFQVCPEWTNLFRQLPTLNIKRRKSNGTLWLWQEIG